MDVSGRLNPERGNAYAGVASGNGVETKNTKVLHQGYSYTYKHLTMDEEAKNVTVNGNKLDITAKEYGILRVLLTNPNKLFQRQICSRVCGMRHIIRRTMSSKFM